MLVACLAVTGPGQPAQAALFPPLHLWRKRRVVPPVPPRATTPPRAVRPVPSPRPAAPSVAATPVPTIAPSVAPIAPPPDEAHVILPEAHARAWGVSNRPGDPTGRSQPVWSLDGTLWDGAWGLGVGTTVFGEVFVIGRAAPFFEAGTFLTDVWLRYRDLAAPAWAPRFEGELGYRGLGLGDVNFFAAGAGLEWPLDASTTSLTAHVNGSMAVGGAYCLDGQAGIRSRWRALSAEAGLRDLVLSVGSQPPVSLLGPYLGVGASF